MKPSTYLEIVRFLSPSPRGRGKRKCPFPEGEGIMSAHSLRKREM